MPSEPKCCLFCGRDTRDRSGICWHCTLPGYDVGIRRDVRGGHRPDDPEALEDRYDDESGPDDVVVDWPGRDELEFRQRGGRSERHNY